MNAIKKAAAWLLCISMAVFAAQAYAAEEEPIQTEAEQTEPELSGEYEA